MGLFDDLPDAAPAGNTIVMGRMTPAQAAPAGLFDDLPDAKQGRSWGETAMGLGRALAAGIDSGVAHIAGAPADLARLGQKGYDLAESYVTDEPYAAVHARNDEDRWISPSLLEEWGSDAAHRGSPLYYEPQTTAEQFVKTGADFATGAAVFPVGGAGSLPARMADSAVRYGLVPGIVSEGAGQLTEGTELEPWARGGAALATGGIMAAAARPSAGSQVSRATRGATPQQLDDAERLFQDAQRMGVPVTRFEAIDKVTNGATNAGNLQRVVEGQGGMREFMARRPEQNRAAVTRVLDEISPPSPDPNMIGPRLGQAAEGIVTDANAARTAQVSDFYRQAAPEKVPQQQIEALISDIDTMIARDKTGLSHGPLQDLRQSLIAREATPGTPAVRSPVTDPRTGRIIRYEQTPAVPGTPREVVQDIENLDRSRKYFRDQTELPAFSPNAIDKETGSKVTGLTARMDEMMEDASQAYGQGKDLYQKITRETIEPLMAGPIGKLAQHDVTTKKVIDVLFPKQPLENSAPQILDAVTKLSARMPNVSREVVRTYLAGEFNRISGRMQGTNAQRAGATFRQQVIGNPDQAANLAAAMQGLPNGKDIVRGVDRLMDAFQAQGYRQPIGSQTAFNAEMIDGLRNAGWTEGAIKIAMGGGLKLPSKAMETIERWRLGKNVDELARLATDPKAGPVFRQLAESNSLGKTAALITRLAVLAGRGAQQGAGNTANSPNTITVTPRR